MPKANANASMRQDWDERAKRNAFFYVATWRDDWTLESFLQSGEEEFGKLVQPVFEEFGLIPEGRAMLEVGCGAGRMTGSFARRFGSVCAFDVSGEMQKLARQHLAGMRNIRWVLGDGQSLAAIQSNSVDFVFSYLVLHHLPTRELGLTYIKEMLRVLKPGGVYLFQFNSRKSSPMNWRGRMAWGVINGLWSLRMKPLAQRIARLLSFDPAMAGKSWGGASLVVASVANTIRVYGGLDPQIAGELTELTWCRGRKSQEDSGNYDPA